MNEETEVLFQAIGDTAIKEEERKNRVLWLTQEVDEDIISLTKSIIQWNLADREIEVDKRQPIILMIDSPGGYLEPALTLSDVMLASKTPIWTINLGLAGSAAALIYLSGEKRAAFENATFLLHEGEASASGTYLQLNQNMKHYQRQVEQMKRAIISRLNLDADLERDLLEGMTGKDLYLYRKPLISDELSAIQFGFVNATVDEVLLNGRQC